MKQPTGCICKHPDARQCLLLRHHDLGPRDLLSEQGEEQVCECACHHEDEDGLTEWDDPEATHA